jgi:hypothetical protein
MQPQLAVVARPARISLGRAAAPQAGRGSHRICRAPGCINFTGTRFRVAAMVAAKEIQSGQITLAAIFTVSANSVTLKMNEMMPWAETV